MDASRGTDGLVLSKSVTPLNLLLSCKAPELMGHLLSNLIEIFWQIGLGVTP